MKLQTLKQIVNVVSALGAASIATQIIRSNVVPASPIAKITIPVATLVIGAMAGELVGDYTDTKIDEIAEAVNESKMTVYPVA